jgi:hypothetical protein
MQQADITENDLFDSKTEKKQIFTKSLKLSKLVKSD